MATKFKLPTKVELMGKTIPIVRKPLKNAYGMFYRTQFRIEIDTDCPDELLEQTLLHELVHAALTISGVYQVLENDVEEAICLCLENLTTVYKPRSSK